jgi:type II secretory ATPase GspE/PulE/Tfp pilus assembly ATPase PilB-like protein
MDKVKKTILDILLEKNRLTESEAGTFDRNLNNEQIEAKLRSNNTVNSADIAKAYSELYDLPQINLTNLTIQRETYQIIPHELVIKYFLVAFEKDGNNPGGKVKIAIGKPANLNENINAAIEKLRQTKNISTELYITTPEDIENTFRKFGEITNNPTDTTINIKNVDNKAYMNKTGTVQTVDLKNFKIPFEVVSKFPIEISRKYNMVVFENPSPNLIKVAVSDPYSQKVREIMEFVKEKNEIQIMEYVASPSEINEAINLYYRKENQTEIPTTQIQPPPPVPAVNIDPQKNVNQVPTITVNEQPKIIPKPQFIQKPNENGEIEEKTIEEDFQKPAETDLDKFLGQEVKDIEALKQVCQTGNVPQILAATIALAVFNKASDIHIEQADDNLRIRFRVDGVLKDIIKLPNQIGPALISRIKILSRMKIDEQRIPQDGRFDAKTHNHQIDLRISTLPTVKGEKAAIRILDKTQNIFTLEELGIAGKSLKVIENNITKPYGIILSTGPTGSGKSTTLYSILQKISSPEINVITLEDPVEYEIPGINQCQVKPKIGFSFAEGLRSVLRQDPNIIMVGEIRDSETAAMATHAALTGHLVLSTLHTNDAAGALPRLMNMGIEPFLITSSINIIIAQRLVRKICQKCKAEVRLPEELMVEINKSLEKFNLQKPYKFFEAKGCPECNQGYSGRIGLFEVLEMSEKIEEIAVKKRPAFEIAAAAVSEGMVTLKQDGLIKATKGLTTVSEILRVTLTS